MLEKYDYKIREALIAKSPAAPRDSSRLFVYDTLKDEITFDYFYNLPKYLPEKSLLVFNNTKVLPARLIVEKETGGKAEILLSLNERVFELESREIRAIADRQLKVGSNLYLKKKAVFCVRRQEEQFFILKPLIEYSKLRKIIMTFGETPLPPYMGKRPLKESVARKKYQTIFAKVEGSIAAPTASLHFTERVFAKLEKKGIKREEVTLHVGMGTFAPIDENNFKSNHLHSEFFTVDKNTWQNILHLKSDGYRIVPVGTTATRVLETISKMGGNKLSGSTDIFIYPPYKFEMTDVLITNFHVPKSSLMLLVEAFLKHKGAKRGILDLYRIAIKNDFRFYSFGDSMLIK